MLRNRRSTYGIIPGLPAASMVFALAVLVGGCATPQHNYQPQTVAVPTPTPSQAKTADSNYIIGPDDTLEVFVWRNPELSITVPVRPDGKISTPLVEDMVAVGKTAPQLARDMEKVLSEYVSSPKVNIIVKYPPSAFSLVKVVGAVAHPQELRYREGMTVLDAILAAGGLTPFADGSRSHIVRIENGKDTDIEVNQNVQLKPGDVLVIPTGDRSTWAVPQRLSTRS